MRQSRPPLSLYQVPLAAAEDRARRSHLPGLRACGPAAIPRAISSMIGLRVVVQGPYNAVAKPVAQRAVLSSRMPLKDGWRIWPSRVQAVNSTSAT